MVVEKIERDTANTGDRAEIDCLTGLDEAT
jgi:hypothetical protein